MSANPPRRPTQGPGFLPLGAWLYRVEMGLGLIGLLIILFYWRLFVVGGLNLGLTIFWILWPDLAAFIPIGAASRGQGDWPPWGSTLYNSTHTFLTWLSVFAIWTALEGGIEWPLLGWAGHIAGDRALGFHLRMRPSPEGKKDV